MIAIDVRLTAEEFEQLKAFSADQLFWARSAVEGLISGDYTDQSIRCFSPELGTVAGYAVDERVDHRRSRVPGPRLPRLLRVARVDPRAEGRGDEGRRPARRPAGGGLRQHAGAHDPQLGVVGVVSSVGIQKPHLVRDAGMPVWSTGVAPAHGPYHLVRYGAPVVVGSVRWTPGDLVFADVTGAIRIPAGIAREILARAQADAASPGPGYFDVVDAPDFTVAKLRAWIAQHPSIYPPVDPAKVDAWWERNGAGLAPRSEGISRPKPR